MASIVKKTGLNRFVGRILPRRHWVQAGFLLVWLGPLGLRMHNVCGPVFHCYACPLASFACPIGVMAQFSALHVIPFLAIGTVLTVGALFGSLICGWVCPFGLLQTWGPRFPSRSCGFPRGRVLPLRCSDRYCFAVPGSSEKVIRCLSAGSALPCGSEKAMPDVISQAVTARKSSGPTPSRSPLSS